MLLLKHHSETQPFESFVSLANTCLVYKVING